MKRFKPKKDINWGGVQETKLHTKEYFKEDRDDIIVSTGIYDDDLQVYFWAGAYSVWITFEELEALYNALNKTKTKLKKN